MKVRVSGVKFRYPGSDFSIAVPELEVGSGESLALVGPSGCGKTTFLNLLSGLLLPQAGEIEMGNRRLADLPDRERRRFRATQTGYVFQDFGLLDYLTALENILFPVRAAGLGRPEDLRPRARDLAGRMGIGHVLGRKPVQLSQGERQRTAICRAMLMQPPVMLADEPTGNLDPASKQTAMDLLFEQAGSNGATLIAVTHDPALARRFDRTVDFSTFTRAGR